MVSWNKNARRRKLKTTLVSIALFVCLLTITGVAQTENTPVQNGASITETDWIIPVKFKDVEQTIKDSGLELMIGGNALDMGHEAGLRFGVIAYEERGEIEYGIYERRGDQIEFRVLDPEEIGDDAVVYVVFWNPAFRRG